MTNEQMVELNGLLKKHLLELYEYSMVVPISMDHFKNAVEEYALCYNVELMKSAPTCSIQYSKIEKILNRNISPAGIYLQSSISRRMLIQKPNDGLMYNYE